MGDVRFNEWQAVDGTPVLRYEAGALEVWNGSTWSAAGGISVDFLVAASGGGGGYQIAGGGGAGNVLTSTFVCNAGTTLSVIVGAGGAGAVSAVPSGSKGLPSQIGDFRPVGGGAGTSDNNNIQPNSFGASGGGIGRNGGGIPYGYEDQGNQGAPYPGGNTGGGGGGKGSAGSGVNGGAGISSSISGASLFYAGGGGGNDYYGTGGLGGSGVGGNGGTDTTPGTPGLANRGGGGGAGGYVTPTEPGQNGGSGVVILAVPVGTSMTFSAGVSRTTAVVGSKDVYTVTSTSTTSETVTIG